MKKIFVYFAVFAALIFVTSCGGGSKSSDTTDTGESVSDEDRTDSSSTDAEPNGDTEPSDTVPDTPDGDNHDATQEHNDDETDADTQNDSDTEEDRKQGELYGECYPNDTCNNGLVCDVENNICIKDTESSENNDNDSDTIQGDDDSDMVSDNDTDADSGDTAPDNDIDTDTDTGDLIPDNDTDAEPVDPCNPNPCIDVENSTKECAIFGITYQCVCNSGYFWDGSVCGTVQTQTVNCTGLPNNAEWNTASEIIQTWDNSLGTWVPVATGSYNEIASTNQCRFKCEENYIWSNNSQCLYNMDNDPLMWSSSQEKGIGFLEETACSTVSDGGFSDWRLPTIDELRTLIQNCDNTKTGGACGVTNECLSWDECRTDNCNGCDKDLSGKYSKLGDNSWLYSVSEQPDNEHNYVVDFSMGQINDINNVINPTNLKYYYRCVRNAD